MDDSFRVAEKRHADGWSCRTTLAYIYDANGHRRYCIDCKAPLEEASFREGGADFPLWGWGLVSIVVGILVLLVLSVLLPTRPENLPAPGAPPAIPTTYGYPPNGQE